MDSKTICEVLEKLIGFTRAIGVSEIDRLRSDNQKALIDVTNWCLETMKLSAEVRHSSEISIRQNGETAYSALMQMRDFINDVIEENA